VVAPAQDITRKLRRRCRPRACAQGTGSRPDGGAGERKLPAAELRTSWLYALAQTINTTPSIYLEAAHPRLRAGHEDRPWSIWRTSAQTPSTRSQAGCFKHGVPAHDKIFYTTGRLTSEMVIKTVAHGHPI